MAKNTIEACHVCYGLSKSLQKKIDTSDYIPHPFVIDLQNQRIEQYQKRAQYLLDGLIDNPLTPQQLKKAKDACKDCNKKQPTLLDLLHSMRPLL